MWGKRAKFWKTIPNSRWWVGTSVTSLPSRKIRPSSGRLLPVRHRRAVVLPHPEGPSRVISSPRRIARLTWSLATSVPYRFVTSRNSIMASAIRQTPLNPPTSVSGLTRRWIMARISRDGTTMITAMALVISQYPSPTAR